MQANDLYFNGMNAKYVPRLFAHTPDARSPDIRRPVDPEHRAGKPSVLNHGELKIASACCKNNSDIRNAALYNDR